MGDVLTGVIAGVVAAASRAGESSGCGVVWAFKSMERLEDLSGAVPPAYAGERGLLASRSDAGVTRRGEPDDLSMSVDEDGKPARRARRLGRGLAVQPRLRDLCR
jgi:hypothetical protein